jgi:hypothetical protein
VAKLLLFSVFSAFFAFIANFFPKYLAVPYFCPFFAVSKPIQRHEKTSRTNIEGSGLFCAIKCERVRPQYTTAPRGVWDNHPKGFS